MTDQVKAKAVNMEDMQSFAKVLFNKGIGNRGVCTTAAATAAKEVTLGTTFSLVDGAMVLICFTYGISVANATLAVTYGASGSQSTTAAKPIYYRGAALAAGAVKAGDTLMLKYENSSNNRWVVVGTLGSDYPTFGASGTNHASGLVPDPGATQGSTKFLREDATWAEPDSVPANAVLFSSDSGEGVVPSDGIKAETVSAGATISVNPDTVTVVSGNVGTAAITLQVPNDNLAHVWDILMTTGASVNVTIATSNSATIKVPSGFAVGASKSCEIHVIGVGSLFYLKYGEFA